MFFEIITSSGKKNYLFGTMHLNDKEITTLPIEVKQAYDNATRVVFETDDSNVSSIFSLINQWQKNNNTLELPPIFEVFSKIIMVNKQRYENSLDNQLEVEAKRRGKKVGFLAPVEQEFKAILGFSFDFFEQSIYYNWVKDSQGFEIEHINKTLENTKRKYLANDELSESYTLDKNAPEVVYKLMQTLYTDRDIIQAEAMKPFMEEGNVFVAVGNAHLKGITEKLRSEGYTVNLIPLSERIYSISGYHQKLFDKPKSSGNDLPQDDRVVGNKPK